MAEPVIVYGKSGTGKSTSLRNFQAGEVGLVNVIGKRLPFRNSFPQVCTTDYAKVKELIEKSKAKSIVVDDAGYLITDMFMSRHANAGKGNGVFALYNDIGDEFYKLLRFVSELPDQDKIVYLMLHEDTDDMGNSKIKTIGKLLDEKVTIEGMVSIVLHSTVTEDDYTFQTNGNGIVKSPPGMFESENIPNDLKAVDTAIREYWGMAPLVDKPKGKSAPKAAKSDA